MCKLSYKAKQIIPHSSVNEVTRWQAEIFLPVHERAFLFDAKKFLGSVKGTAKPVQACTGPEGSRRLGLPDFKTVRLSALRTGRLYWYSLLSEAESTPGT
jgi:hypothetical protein